MTIQRRFEYGVQCKVDLDMPPIPITGATSLKRAKEVMRTYGDLDCGPHRLLRRPVGSKSWELVDDEN